jgi:hemolysin activation/secretion protein
MNYGKLVRCHGRWMLIAAVCATQTFEVRLGVAAQQKWEPSKLRETKPPQIQNATTLQGIVVVGRQEDLKPTSVTEVKGVEVQGPDFLRRPDFEKLLKRHLGARLTAKTVTQIQTEIQNYCQSHKHKAQVIVGEQEVTRATLQFAVLEMGEGQTAAAQEAESLFATNLHGILILPSVAEVEPAGVTGIRGVVVKGPNFLRRPGFTKMLKRHLGAPLTGRALTQIQVEIKDYCQAHDHLVVDVISQQQEVLEGTIQIAVIEAKIGHITVENPGRKWFPDSVITNNVRLKPGQSVLESRFNSDLNWLNQDVNQNLGYDGFNSRFLDVSGSFHQGNLGETDVKYEAVDRLPLRGFVGVDDAGIAIIGTDRLFVGADAANPYWLGNRLTYQYTTDVDFDKFSQNSGTIVFPLPWRHEITIFGTYADLNPDFSVINPSLSNLKEKGFFWQVSPRYTIPLPPTRNYTHEITAGFDFKRTDTPLLFESSGVGGILSTNQIDVAQFSVAYSGRLYDHLFGRLGMTAWSIQGFYSPGGIGENNNNESFNAFQQGATADYVYGRVEIRRTTDLGRGVTWFTRATGQLSDARLVATEAYSLGGWDTVRGYDQTIVSGDNGWLFVNELRTRPFALFGNLHGKGDYDPTQNWASIRGGKLHGMDWMQLLVFCDYGGVYYRNPPAPGWPSQEILLSVGAGFRYQLWQNMLVRFDYGWQLDRNYMNAPAAPSLGPQPTSRAHFAVELTF